MGCMLGFFNSCVRASRLEAVLINIRELQFKSDTKMKFWYRK